MKTPLPTEAHWRARAEEARAQASEMDDPVAKKTLLMIAESYDQLADFAARRAAATPRSVSS